MNTFKELLQFILENKKWWLIPTLLIFAFFGFLLYLGSGSVTSPFVYTLF